VLGNGYRDSIARINQLQECDQIGFDHTRLFTAEAPTVFTRWIASWRKNTSKRREGMAGREITFGMKRI
jgi:hypothetical protein